MIDNKALLKKDKVALKNISHECYFESRSKVNAGDWEGSAILMKRASEIYKIIGELSWAARTEGRLGWGYIAKTNFDEALQHFKQAEQFNKEQAAGNYLWASYQCLRGAHTERAREYFREFLKLVKIILEPTEFETFSLIPQDQNLQGWLLIYNDLVVRFYSKIVEQEEKEEWPEWAMSDRARLYSISAELELTKGTIESRSKAKELYFTASKEYKKSGLAGYESFCLAKYYILCAILTHDYNTILEKISNAIKELCKVRDRIGGEYDLTTLLENICKTYKMLIEIRKGILVDIETENKEKYIKLNNEIKKVEKHLVAIKKILDKYKAEEVLQPFERIVMALSETLTTISSSEYKEWPEKLASALMYIMEANFALPGLDLVGFQELVKLELLTLENTVKVLSSKISQPRSKKAYFRRIFNRFNIQSSLGKFKNNISKIGIPDPFLKKDNSTKSYKKKRNQL